MSSPVHYLLQFLFIFQCGLIRAVRGVDEDGYFSNPATKGDVGPVFTLGDTEVIAWETHLDVFNITLWQQSLVEDSASTQGNIFSKTDEDAQITNFTWAVQLYGFDLEVSNVFFLWTNPNRPEGFTSSFFNITKEKKTTNDDDDDDDDKTKDTKDNNDKTKPTTTSTVAPSEISAVNPAEITTIAPSQMTDSSPSQTYNPNSSPSGTSLSSEATAAGEPSGLTQDGKIALGVGLGVGIPILAALIALIWLKVRPRPAPEPDTAYLSPPTFHELHSPQMIAREVKGGDPREYYAELPDQTR